MELGITRTVPYPYEEAIDRVKAALKDVGFGVLTEIDVKDTIKKKINKDFRKYVILGACNPNHAYEVLSQEPMVGLMLPCNVIVYEDNGETVVSAINPVEAIGIIGNEGLNDIAKEVSEKLKKAVEML